MKWLTHEVVTGVIVYAATEDPMAAIYSMAGAIVPDKVEGNPFQRRSLFGIRCAHRGWSHWPMLYLLIGGAALRGEEYLGLSLGTLGEIIFFMAVGALLHIAEDAICGKVPFITPTQKIGVKLFKVGSIREYIVALILIIGAYGIKIVLG